MMNNIFTEKRTNEEVKMFKTILEGRIEATKTKKAQIKL